MNFVDRMTIQESENWIKSNSPEIVERLIKRLECAGRGEYVDIPFPLERCTTLTVDILKHIQRQVHGTPLDRKKRACNLYVR